MNINNEIINIRSITLGLHSNELHTSKQFSDFHPFFSEAEQVINLSGRSLRTKRVCLSPINENREFGIEYAMSLIKTTQRIAALSGIRWICVPFNLNQPKHFINIEKVPVDVIKTFPNCFINLLVARNNEISLEGAKIAASIIKNISRLSQNGFDNFRVGVSSNCKPNTPFFPFSYHSDTKPGFTMALETLNFLFNVYQKNKENLNNLSSIRHLFLDSLSTELMKIKHLAQELSSTSGVNFLGVDLSLAPYPNEQSVSDILEVIGVDFVGSYGSVFATSIITDILREAIYRADIKSVGFNGVMYSPLEDTKLAKSSNMDLISIDSLMLYSTVCGCGIDMVPIPGDTFEDEISSIILDVSALSIAHKKPLGVRLLPIALPSGSSFTSYNYDFLVNTRVKTMKKCAFEFHRIKDKQIGYMSPRS